MMAETSLQQGDIVLPNLPQHEMKAEPTTPKRMLKSLKRAYSSSMACIETHMRLSSYQNVLHKKLVLKTFTKEDRQEIRKICEDLVYTIQLSQDRGTYVLALKLLSSVAAAPDPIAFILHERHIGPVLRRALESATQPAADKANALLHLLDHLEIRHSLSVVRQIITDVTSKPNPNAAHIISVESACRALTELLHDGHQEMWVKLMIQDLFATVAKHPSTGFVLLEDDIYPFTARVSGGDIERLASNNKLSRRLARLIAEDSPVVREMRRSIIPMLVEPVLDRRYISLAREICSNLIRLIRERQDRDRTCSAWLLELIARSKSAVSRILIEREFFEAIERMWTSGVLPSDKLYQLVKSVLDERLQASQAFVESYALATVLPDDVNEMLIEVFRDLLHICRGRYVYKDSSISKALSILKQAASSSEALSFLLVHPTLLHQYTLLPEDMPGAKGLLDSIPHLHHRKKLKETDMLISRLKHTRQWSGLDSDNVRPLAQTLVDTLLDPHLQHLHYGAINSLIELTKSPPDCASILLRPEFEYPIQTYLSDTHTSSPTNTRQASYDHGETDTDLVLRAKKGELAKCIAALKLQRKLREDVPKLFKLSNKRSVAHPQSPEWVGFKQTVDDLVHMYREYSRNDVVAQTLIKSLLVVATGCEPAKEVLQRACAKYEIGTKGDELSFLKIQENSSSASTELVSRSRGQGRPAGDTPPQESPMPLQQAQSKRVDDALHDIIRYLEHAVDVLMQRQVGELIEEDEERLRIICSRLLQICRLDITEWSTVSAIELLGSIAKGTVLFSSPTLSPSTLTLKKGRVLSTVPQRRPVVMTDEMLAELEQLEKRERLRLPVQRIRVLLQS